MSRVFRKAKGIILGAYSKFIGKPGDKSLEWDSSIYEDLSDQGASEVDGYVRMEARSIPSIIPFVCTTAKTQARIGDPSILYVSIVPSSGTVEDIVVQKNKSQLTPNFISIVSAETYEILPDSLVPARGQSYKNYALYGSVQSLPNEAGHPTLLTEDHLDEVCNVIAYKCEIHGMPETVMVATEKAALGCVKRGVVISVPSHGLWDIEYDPSYQVLTELIRRGFTPVEGVRYG